MADINTALRAIQIAPTLGSRLKGRELTAAIMVAMVTHTVTAAEAAADVLNIIDLPVGCQLLTDQVKISNDAAGGTAAVISKLGDATDDDRYSATNVALTAAGIVTVTPTNAIMVTPYRIELANVTLKATLAGTFPMTAGKKITFQIPYLAQV